MSAILIWAVLIAASPVSVERSHVQPGQFAAKRRVVSTDNFDVTADLLGAREVAAECERLRSWLQQTWLEDASAATWSPRCTVVVHASKNSYCAAVGRGSETSAGSSWIGQQDGRISGRRIDLLVVDGSVPALGHELSHVVLADLFAGQRPPPWADEGIALLADSEARRQLHHRDLRHALSRQAAWPLATLLTSESYPASGIPAFYGQSAAVTALLVRRGSPSQFVRFVKAAQGQGYDQALRESYAIDGIPGLERLLRTELSTVANDARR